MEVFPSNTSPHPSNLNPPGPVNQNIIFHNSAAPPENTWTIQQKMQRPVQLPTFQRRDALTTDVNVSLFHWQIQQEAQKVEGLSAEQLNMQDSDGDTYVWICKIRI